jgi:dipeptidyl aminopeptidase/acylaminoacyl peptidase
MQDYLDGIDAMAKEPFVDRDRLGAVGASYGGYSVFYLAGIHNKRFKAFVSHCGVYNTIAEYCSTEEYWYPNKITRVHPGTSRSLRDTTNFHPIRWSTSGIPPS